MLLDEPIRWSEGLGKFTATVKEGAIFALGSGETSSQLHTPDYDFPDDLIPIDRDLFLGIIRQIHGFNGVHT